MTIPTILTFIRLVSAVSFIPFFIFYGADSNNSLVIISLTITIIFLSLTDFFDGYLARRYQQETMLGRLLDPLADKCLVISMLITLTAMQKIYFYWVLLVIMREIIITGLRSIAHYYQTAIPVIFLGKLKTTVQYCFCVWIIAGPVLVCNDTFVMIYYFLLVLMLLFSLGSGLAYGINFMKQWPLFKRSQ